MAYRDDYEATRMTLEKEQRENADLKHEMTNIKARLATKTKEMPHTPTILKALFLICTGFVIGLMICTFIDAVNG
jgi:hypothetical protein